MPFRFEKLPLDGLVLVKPDVFEDSRGFFMEDYKRSEFRANGIDWEFVQENRSISKKGVLRGLHYQLKPAEQGKLVQVVRGSVFDVAVDIRKKSLQYGKWLGVDLSAQAKSMLFVPPGFAHGFEALEDDTEVSYNVTNEYSKENERGILWNDKTLGIEWPIKEPTVSAKDKLLPELACADNNF